MLESRAAVYAVSTKVTDSGVGGGSDPHGSSAPIPGKNQDGTVVLGLPTREAGAPDPAASACVNGPCQMDGYGTDKRLKRKRKVKNPTHDDPDYIPRKIRKIHEKFPLIFEVTERRMNDERELCGMKEMNENKLRQIGNPFFGVFWTNTVPGINVVYSREQLLARDDNLMHFLSEDFLVTSPIGVQIVEAGLINLDEFKTLNPKVGEVMLSETKTPVVFSMFVREKHDDRIQLEALSRVFETVKATMIQRGWETVSIAQKGDGIDRVGWPAVEKLLRECFTHGKLVVTICTCEITTPPIEDRARIIEEFHGSKVGGHKGIDKTLRRIREKFCWKGMKAEVEAYIKTCISCQEQKLVRNKTRFPMMITTTPTEPFEVVELDVVGPLRVSSAGFEYILTIHDIFSKYTVASPMVCHTAEMVAYTFTESFLLRFGCPDVIKTDQGPEFMSRAMKKFAELFGIEQMRGTAFHPQSQGSIERSHFTLIEYLRHFCTTENWDMWLPFSIFSYNTSVHSAIGITPHEVIFGRRAVIPSEFATGKIKFTYVQFLDNLAAKLSDTQKFVAARLGVAKQKSKVIYDRKLNETEFKVGSFVWLLNDARSHKLESHYMGPYLIVNIPGERCATLQLEKKLKTLHFDKLKLGFFRFDDSNDDEPEW